MIKANHNKIAKILYNFYIDKLLKNNFSDFIIINNPPNIDEKKSLIITPNHISWWDGFFVERVARKNIKKLFHLMMLEEELVKIKFFSNVGAFSISQKNVRKIIETFNYIHELLIKQNNLVVFYPQGEIEDFYTNPLNIKNGIKFLIEKNNIDTQVLIVGFKIQYFNKKHPTILCRFGEILHSSDIINNFDLYKEKFHDNIKLLNKAYHQQQWYQKIF